MRSIRKQEGEELKPWSSYLHGSIDRNVVESVGPFAGVDVDLATLVFIYRATLNALSHSIYGTYFLSS